MHSIKDLEDHFGLSYWKARKRLRLIRDNFDGEVKGGQNSKYYLTDNGLTILDRILELEDQNHDLSAAVEQVKNELETSSETEEATGSNQNKVNPKYVQRLENEVEFLREELRKKDQQIQQLLPAAKEEKSNGSGRVTLWGALSRWWNSDF